MASYQNLDVKGKPTGHSTPKPTSATSQTPTESSEDGPPLAPASMPVSLASNSDSGGGLRFYPYTDTGNGERLASKFGEQIRYCHQRKHWYSWRGNRWAPDDSGDLWFHTKQIARLLYQEASLFEEKEDREKCAKWARASESAKARRAALECAQSEPLISVDFTSFDADPMLFNCLNGTVDLTTGELRPHRKSDMLTHLAPVHYDPDATSDLWERFLEQTTGSNAILRYFLQRAVGYSLTGGTEEEVLFFAHGPAATGKSTFLEALKATLGDYAQTADFETFVKKRGDGGIRNDIAALAGRRLVISIEVDEGKKLAEGLVKMMTGGDTVAARFLYKELFNFVPTCKLWLAANHAPKVKDDDTAMWRRILRVPFDHVVAKHERDPGVKARLRNAAACRSAILSWAVDGCLVWQSYGLNVPQVVAQATDEYRMQMDPLRDFLDSRCILQSEASVGVTELRAAYESFFNGETSNGIGIVGVREFNERLKARSCSQYQKWESDLKKNVLFWRGIGLML